MATIEVFNQCVAARRERGEVDFYTNTHEPDLKRLFGEKHLVDKGEFERCSESEQRRHLNEDRVLRAFYIDPYSDFECVIYNDSTVVASN